MSSSKLAIDPSGTEKILSNPELVEFIANEASTYASTHGLLMKQDEKTYMHAPCTLLPTPIPEAAFELAKSLAPDFNLLVEAVSKDADFMLSSLSSVAKADDFLRRLVEIYTTVQREGPAQPVSLGVHRSDYMLQEENEAKGIAPHFLQVEINTISAGFACLSAVVTEMHRYLIERHLSHSLNLAKVPVNSSRVSVVNGLAAATKLHPNPKAVVVMVIQPGERNVADQRWLEYTLWDLHKIPMIRRTFLEIHARGQLDPNTKDIVIDGHTAGLFYFRSGYGPKDYTSDKEWETLLRIERSRAVKCPTVAYHLAGCKKIQQELARPGVVERYLPAEAAARVRKCFAGLWGLEHDDAATKAVIQDAIANPNDYVLKPQRNGGGNNLWGDEISHALSTLSVEDRSAYILMKKITPVISRNALMRGGSASVGDTIFELGMYSTFLGGGGKVLINEYSGHLLRTKFVGVNEGGVAAGFSCLDAPLLVPGAPITLSN